MPADNRAPEDQNPMAESRHNPRRADLKIANDFINCLKGATIHGQSEWLSEEYLKQIHNPITEGLMITEDERLALDLLIAHDTIASYTATAAAIARRFGTVVLPYHGAKKLLAKLTGIEPIIIDMCINSCCAYTGPWKNLNRCPLCPAHEKRYEIINGKKVARKQFHTIPLAAQLQALLRDRSSAEKMDYRKEYTNKLFNDLVANEGVRTKFADYFDGTEYIDAVNQKNGKKLSDDDIVVFMSIDGAQLYRNKVSECWMYVWVIMNLSPGERYKKKYVLPGGFIPGPKKPKNVDSFLFPGLYHVAALQNEGIKLWDPRRPEPYVSHPYFILMTADGPGAACVSGLTGHRGYKHCRLYCEVLGRLRNSAHYPALQKPHDPQGETHDDVNIHDLVTNYDTMTAAASYEVNLTKIMHTGSRAEYEKARKETGIVKPSILRGLNPAYTATFPGSMALDVMHLSTLR